MLCYFNKLDNNSHHQKVEADWPSPADMKRFNLIAATLSKAKQAYLKEGQV